MSFAIAYGLSFASITATLTHALLFYREQLWVHARRSLSDQPDIHARLMSVYKQVPDWWYISMFGSYINQLLMRECERTNVLPQCLCSRSV